MFSPRRDLDLWERTAQVVAVKNITDYSCFSLFFFMFVWGGFNTRKCAAKDKTGHTNRCRRRKIEHLLTRDSFQHEGRWNPVTDMEGTSAVSQEWWLWGAQVPRQQRCSVTSVAFASHFRPPQRRSLTEACHHSVDNACCLLRMPHWHRQTWQPQGGKQAKEKSWL